MVTFIESFGGRNGLLKAVVVALVASQHFTVSQGAAFAAVNMVDSSIGAVDEAAPLLWERDDEAAPLLWERDDDVPAPDPAVEDSSTGVPPAPSATSAADAGSDDSVVSVTAVADPSATATAQAFALTSEEGPREFANDDNLDGFSNAGAGGYGPSGGFGLIGGVQVLQKASANPVAPAGQPGKCAIDYQPVLSGASKANHTFTRSNGNLELIDVQQGGIGDCGFGAALLALRGNNENSALNKALVQTDFSATNPVFKARFLALNSGPVNVLVDDLLPAARKGCGTNLASFGSPWHYYYVPLLEKAWAKYVDAYPQFRNIPAGLSAAAKKEREGRSGYPQLQSMQPNNVLRAINGGRRLAVERTRINFDQAFANAVIKCLNGPRSCAILTPHPVDAGRTYGKAANGLYSTNGATLKVNPGSFTYQISDLDDAKASKTIVAGHWYAILRNKSPTVTPAQAINKANKIMVTIRNPWGCNPGPNTKNGCQTPVDIGEVKISLRALWSITTTVQTTY